MITFTSENEHSEADIEHYAEPHWSPHLRHQAGGVPWFPPATSLSVPCVSYKHKFEKQIVFTEKEKTNSNSNSFNSKNSVTDRIIRSSNSLLKSLKSVFPDSSNSDTCTSHGYKLHHSVHLAKKSSLPEESFESSTESSQTNWQSEKKIKKLCCYDRYQLSEVFNLFKNAIDAKLHLFRSGNVGFSFFFFYLIHNSISDLAFVLIHLPHHRHHQQNYKNQRKRHNRWFVPKWKEWKGTYSWFHAFSGDFSPLAFHRLTL